MMEREFLRIKRLPPYVFAVVNELKYQARRQGEDIVDLGMGNPDIPTPKHIVDKLIEAAQNPKNHRYSASKGIPKLREAIANWYKRRYDVDIDPETEAIVTIGAKEALAHLTLAVIRPGDVALVPTPTYPIHTYCSIIAGGDIRNVPLSPDEDFFKNMMDAIKQTWPVPEILILSFPHNPTTTVVDPDFFKKVIDFAKDHNILVIHDFAYADLTFDGYVAPSILQVPGAKDVAVEIFSMSKSYSMAGWRVGFVVGNAKVVQALAKLKSYYDYGIFQPIQIAAIVALNGPQDCVKEIVNIYKKRRDVLCNGLNRIGWKVKKPKGTMFVWAEIPDEYKHMGSLEFSLFLLREAKVAVSPGIGFGYNGDHYVRFALVENEHRIRQALRGIKKALTLGERKTCVNVPKQI
ncbi:alanine-synthesizing transaminase [Thermosulfidibacter takaii ABI70S6]|uniref:Aminotransferase n=2 Tax=Thermosulfidibacter takaii TaxID=412593 RepID=A0A0S3QW28_THET7|nr:alanine-synthesizing transaminase [Thermosulfidibacter takaii ABI70S6]